MTIFNTAEREKRSRETDIYIERETEFGFEVYRVYIYIVRDDKSKKKPASRKKKNASFAHEKVGVFQETMLSILLKRDDM